MEIFSVGSSSSGNSYIIRAAGKVLVLDAGLSCIKITRALEALGLSTEDVAAILITHEHTDHVKSIRILAKKCSDAVIYASRGTAESCSMFADIDDERISLIAAGEEQSEGDIGIRAFALSHDAREPIGYSICSGDDKLSIVTDTGVITEEIFEEIKDASMLVLEANHDEDLLMYGEYPYALKRRIKSDDGHLSNTAAGEFLADLLREKSEGSTADKSKAFPVMLAHLSFHNNVPFRARATIEDILRESGFEREEDYALTIAAKDELTELSL